MRARVYGKLLRTTRRIRLVAGTATLCAVASPRVVNAQASPDSVQHRNECRLAEQILRTGHPHPHLGDALAILPTCGDIPAEVYVGLWSRDDFSEAERAQLVVASRGHPSEPLAEALLTNLAQPDRQRDMRLRALAVLMPYADPHQGPSLDDFATPANVISIVGSPYSFSPPMPSAFRANVRDRAIAVLEAIKASDPDPAMRNAAIFGIRNLKLAKIDQ